MSAAPHQYATKDANEFLPRCLLLLAAPWNITKYEYEKKKKGKKNLTNGFCFAFFKNIFQSGQEVIPLQHPLPNGKRLLILAPNFGKLAL